MLFYFSFKRAAIVGRGWYHGVFKAKLGITELEVSVFVFNKSK
jgi:hypothetical protein